MSKHRIGKLRTDKIPVLLSAIGLLTVLVAVGEPVAAQTDVHVNAGTSVCNSATGNGTLASPYSSLYYALTQTGNVCGKTFHLHAGRYRASYSAAFGPAANAQQRYANCNSSDVDTTSSGSHSVLPIFADCDAANPLIIQNYCTSTGVCDDILLDSTPAVVNTATWQACTGTSPNANCCGAANMNLDSVSKTFCTTNFICSNSETCQFWRDPVNDSDPGVKLRWSSDSGDVLDIRSDIPSDHDGDGNFPADSYFAVSNGAQVVMRMPDGLSPATHDIRMSNQEGHGGGPVVNMQNTSYVTVRRHPLGGHFRVRGGTHSVVLNGAQHTLLENLEVFASGANDYGHCVRLTRGDDNTIRGMKCHDTQSEGIGFYGGGPDDGTQLYRNVVEDSVITNTAVAWLHDARGVGIGYSTLGMGIIFKNCSNCISRRNIVSKTGRDGQSITTSRNNCGGAVCRGEGNIIENNIFFDNCHGMGTNGISVIPYPPADLGDHDCGCVKIQRQGSGITANNIIRGNVCYGAYTNGIPGGHGIYPDGSVNAGTQILYNSIRDVRGAAINLMAVNPTVVTVIGNAMQKTTLTNSCNGNPCVFLQQSGVTHVLDKNTYWASSNGQVFYTNGGGQSCTRDAIGSCDSKAVQFAPSFVSGMDLHLSPTSQLIGAGGTGCTGTDIDGQPRPAGGACEVGADEVGGTAPGNPPAPTGLRLVP